MKMENDIREILEIWKMSMEIRGEALGGGGQMQRPANSME